MPLKLLNKTSFPSTSVMIISWAGCPVIRLFTLRIFSFNSETIPSCWKDFVFSSMFRITSGSVDESNFAKTCKASLISRISGVISTPCINSAWSKLYTITSMTSIISRYSFFVISRISWFTSGVTEVIKRPYHCLCSSRDAPVFSLLYRA